MFKKMWNLLEASLDPQGVRPSDLEVITDKNTAAISGILYRNDVITLTKTISGHTDSFLSFLFGKTMNELADAGDVAFPNLQKMLYIFMRTADHLYNQNEHGRLQFFVNKAFDEKIQIESSARIKAKSIMDILISTKPHYDKTKDTFIIDLEGKKYSLDQNSYSQIQEESLDAFEEAQLAAATQASSNGVGLLDLREENDALRAQLQALKAEKAHKKKNNLMAKLAEQNSEDNDDAPPEYEAGEWVKVEATGDSKHNDGGGD